MPTYAVTAAFLRLFRKLTRQQRTEFLAAVFRVADEVRPGETHIVWEFVGDHDAYDHAY